MSFKNFQVGLSHYPNCFIVKTEGNTDLGKLRKLLWSLGHKYIFVISDFEVENQCKDSNIPVYSYDESDKQKSFYSLPVQELKLAS